MRRTVGLYIEGRLVALVPCEVGSISRIELPAVPGTVLGGPYTTEAPQDDRRYMRRNAQWVQQGGPPNTNLLYGVEGVLGREGGALEALTFSETVPEAPKDGNMYVRKDGAWVLLVLPA